MSVYRVSYRYANSLVQLAEEKNIFEKVSGDGDLIYNTLNDSKELRTVLKSPVIKPAIKKELLEAIFAKKITGETLSFMNFVIEKDREDILFEIFKEFNSLVDKKNGVVKTSVISAVDLNNDMKQNLLNSLEKKTSSKVVANYKIDQKIIGGFIAQVEDTVYDASIKHQLELLRKALLEDSAIYNN
ncbi:MAG: ATP synthase F1 subunit delta [Bacteroidetes bacterium]|nr:ATP synthase F1 subunit delta [Bacteroidota bacterium]